jgi:hypothetical protein
MPCSINLCHIGVDPAKSDYGGADGRSPTGRSSSRGPTKGVRYISVTPWFCAGTCPAVIGKYEVYWDQFHITATYAFFLSGILARSLHL